MDGGRASGGPDGRGWRGGHAPLLERLSALASGRRLPGAWQAWQRPGAAGWRLRPQSHARTVRDASPHAGRRPARNRAAAASPHRRRRPAPGCTSRRAAFIVEPLAPRGLVRVLHHGVEVRVARDGEVFTGHGQLDADAEAVPLLVAADAGCRRRRGTRGCPCTALSIARPVREPLPPATGWPLFSGT